MDIAEYTVTIENEEYVIEIGDQPVTTLFSKARSLAVNSGDSSVTWTFATPLTGVVGDYVALASVQNTSDSFPQELSCRISLFNTTTIVVKLSAPTDTGNYSINIAVLPRFNP